MTRENERPPINTPPGKRTSRLVARKPTESKTAVSHSPSPGRTSLGRSCTSLKGSITLSGSLKVRSPRVPRPTILPLKPEPSTQSSEREQNAVSVGPSCKFHTHIQYVTEEPRQLQPTVVPATSPNKTVRFAEDPSEVQRDPAIIYCAAKPAHGSPASSFQTTIPPIQEDLMITLQRFLALDRDNLEKLQNILHALNCFKQSPLGVVPPAALPTVTIPTSVNPPILTPISSCDTPIEPKLNPEAPAFRDFSVLKSIISPQQECTNDINTIKVPHNEALSPLPTSASSSATIFSDDSPLLKWKMSPEKTWARSVHQRLAETRRNTRPVNRPPARPTRRPALKVEIPVQTIVSIPTQSTPKSDTAPPAAPMAPRKDLIPEASKDMSPRDVTPIVRATSHSHYMPEIPNWCPIQPQAPVWCNAGPLPTAWPPFMPIAPWVHQIPPNIPFGFPFNAPPPPPTLPPPPPYLSPSTPAYYHSPLESNFDDIQDYPDAPGGRVGQALPEMLGDRLLGKFMAKYPMTGTPPLPTTMPRAHQNATVSRKPPPSRKRVYQQGKSSEMAANIQQQLEELILEKKEKEALAKIEKEAKERRSRYQTSALAMS